ncbi:MAG TPA: hypothetical protein VKC35_02480 [Vicinamibacterales bacterium]|jgi:hypothetical protein|nr:hypothetical protein [Vicinamibacterales bacterium]HYS26979.1 hypothetical protein [Vicinamibacterales bacterium]
MKTKWIIGAVALSLAVPAVLYAHAGHVHKIMGTVMARDDRHVEVKTPSGEVLSIAVNDKTAIVRAKKKATYGEVQTGRRVVVDIGDGEDPLIAREIEVGAAKPAVK